MWPRIHNASPLAALPPFRPIPVAIPIASFPLACQAVGTSFPFVRLPVGPHLLPSPRNYTGVSQCWACLDSHSLSHSHSHTHIESRVLSIQISSSGYAKITFGSALSRLSVCLLGSCELISVKMEQSRAKGKLRVISYSVYGFI